MEVSWQCIVAAHLQLADALVNSIIMIW